MAERGLTLRVDLVATDKGYTGTFRMADKDVRKFAAAVRGVDDAQQGQARATRQASQAVKQHGNIIRDVHKHALRYLSAWISIQTAMRSISTIAANTIRQEQAIAQLDARIASTGGSAGIAREELEAMAAAMQRATTFGDEAILESMALLHSFTRISGEAFTGAVQGAANLSVALGQDLRAATLQLAKALDDPVRGLEALRESGTRFSAEQEERIKTMAAEGRILEAQKEILAEIEVQYGGAAEAARDTLGGALDALGNAWGDLWEVSSESTEGIQALIERLTDALAGIDVDELHHDLLAVGQAALWTAGAFGVNLTLGLGEFVKEAYKVRKEAFATAGALGRLRLGLGLLGGPLGIALTAGYAILEFATSSRTAADEVRDLNRELGSLGETTEEYIDSLERMNYAQLQNVEALALESIAATEKLIAEREKILVEGLTAGHGRSENAKKLRLDAAGGKEALEDELTGHRRDLEVAEERLRLAVEQRNRYENRPEFVLDRQIEDARTEALVLQRQLDRMATHSSEAAQRVQRQIDENNAEIERLEAEKAALSSDPVQPGGGEPAAQAAPAPENSILKGYADSYARRMAEAKHLTIAGIIALYTAERAELEAQAGVTRVHLDELERRHAERLEQWAERKIAAAQDAAQAREQTGLPALELLRQENDLLLQATDFSAEAVAQRQREAQADEYRAELRAAYNDISEETLENMVQERLLQDEVVAAHERYEAILEELAPLEQEHAQRQADVTALYRQGALTLEQYNRAMAELRVQQGEGTFLDAWTLSIAEAREEMRAAAYDIGAAFEEVFGPDGKLAVGLSDSIARMLVFGESSREAFAGIAKQAIAELVSQMVQLAIKWVLLNTLFKNVGKAEQEANEKRQQQVIGHSVSLVFQAGLAAFAGTLARTLGDFPSATKAAAKASGIAGGMAAGAIAANQLTLQAARGAVIDEPLYFGYGGERRIGLAGEAGPEAIIPLIRGRDGLLGVRAFGPGGEPRPASRAPATVNMNMSISAVDADGLEEVLESWKHRLAGLVREALDDEGRER